MHIIEGTKLYINFMILIQNDGIGCSQHVHGDTGSKIAVIKGRINLLPPGEMDHIS